MIEELLFIDTLQCAKCDDKEVEFYLNDWVAYCHECKSILPVPEDRIEKVKGRDPRTAIKRFKGAFG